MANFTVVEAVQRSPAWLKARLGRLTASRAADMLATRKDKTEAADRRNLRMQLVLERLTGRPQESGFQSAAMLQGIEREPDACALYEALTGRFLTPTGFLSHNELLAGCSLDGHVGDFEGIVEVKSPIAATHWDYLRSGQIPGDYQKQIIHQLWITGAAWCDWMSYNPDFSEALQVKLVRYERDEAQLKSYEVLVRLFLSEVDRELDEAEAMAGAVA